MSQYSLRKCNTLIPYRTADVILVDAHINEKFKLYKELNTGLVKHEFLSKILKAITDDGN
uniref:Uncharacterized protein n=1 Tax=Schistosoma mansoni TaxID=6183 RepID=A0AA82N2N2_SCHMA